MKKIESKQATTKVYSLEESVQYFAEHKADYYKQWMFEEPLILSSFQFQSAKELHNILYKLIHRFVNNYKRYEHLMPLEDKVKNALKYWKNRPYKIGTFRTDFVYDAQSQMKIIEITCRFALNGMFLSACMNHVSEGYQKINCQDLKTEHPYQNIFNHLEQIRNFVDTLFVLKGDDTKNASKVYIEIYERMGLKIIPIHYNEIKSYLDSMKQAWIISELALEEITLLDDATLEALSKLNIINDFRTVFLVHDKRFFSVIGDTELQQEALTPNEILAFQSFYIPTYSYDSQNTVWQKAKKDKDKWIIKHRSLGKSQEIYAGIVTSEEEWRKLFDSPNIEEMVLQEWIPQKRIKGIIKAKEYQDYLTGTLLYFDEFFFGFGDFRTSSFPITNKVDHRKASHLILKEDTNFENYNFENFIK